MDARTRAVGSIAQAQIELDRALVELEAIRTFDPGLIGAVAHALSNYATVIAATIEMLQLTLRDHADHDVPVWLEGIRHATDLMQHSVGRLVSAAAPSDFPLKIDYVNLAVLMERACEYHRRRTAAEQIKIMCRAVGHVPLARADRVAVAVVAENLLSNAVRVSGDHGAVHVEIVAEPGHVICRVTDSGPGLTPEQQQRVLHRPLPPAGEPMVDDVSGFGLSVAHEFVRRMGGDLWCESEPGQGARFSFRLPAVE